MNPHLMQRRTLHAILALFAAPLLVWPALLNRFPLLFPDTLDYIEQGRPALFALLHTQHPAFTGMRSAAYALAILPFHRDAHAWPVLLLHALAVVTAVYFTLRTVAPRNTLTPTLLTLILLSLCTTMPWYISLLMPDILGAAAYLALFVLHLDREHLNRAQTATLIAIAVLGLTAHTSHILLAAPLVLLCVPLRTFAPFASKFSFQLPLLSIAISTALLLTLNYRLYGHASLAGSHPPYLEARLLADGPGATYLRTHCFDVNIPLLCMHTDRIPANDDDFLWGDGLYATASPLEQAELIREESPFALATLRTQFPAELRAAARNVFAQLTHFGLDDFDNNDYMQAHLNDALPNTRAAYDRSLQAHDAMPWHAPTIINNLAVLASLITLAIGFRKATTVPRSFAIGILVLVVANAALTGIVSEVDARYQARIIWLVPLAAIMVLLERFRPQSSS